MRIFAAFVACALLVTAGACGSDNASSGSPNVDAGSTDGNASDGSAGGGNDATSAGGDAASEAGGENGSSPTVGGCAIFPPNDPWNTDIRGAGVDTTWTTNLQTYATLAKMHPDFGSNFGIPINVVPQNQTPLTMNFDGAPSESDPGPYPFLGSTSLIEGGTPASCSGDCHVLTLQMGACLLYEGDGCSFSTGNNAWTCYSGAKWDLSKLQYGQRTIDYTSADAAGLPIMPGLVRYEEVAAGVVSHAIRFTMHCTQDGYVAPASHQAVPNQCPSGISQADLRAEYPPMGTRIRLKSSYDISTMSAQAKVVATAMQHYGLILADNGSDWFFQGEPNAGFDDDQLNDLKNIPDSALEVITMPTIMH